MAILLTEGVSSSAGGELAIDEAASRVSLAPNICILPGVSLVVRENEECVEKFVDHLSGARHFVLEGAVDDNDSFVDSMSGFTAVRDAESKGWTFVDALARVTLSVETLVEGAVDTSRLPIV